MAMVTHYYMGSLLLTFSEDVSCMFSHCDQCWELITVDVLGVGLV